MSEETHPPRVGLFVTCLVDMFRPTVGFAAVKLLEQAGCAVEVPQAQTCCGQPAYNNGNVVDTRKIARQVITAFESFDYVVGASASCMGMIKIHYPELFEGDAVWQSKAEAFSNRCYELISFLADVRGMTEVQATFNHVVAYHDACSGLRELGIKQQPRTLLKSVRGLKLNELAETEVCCGFGGTFCIKYPDISTRIVSDKVKDIEATKASVVLAGDLGCLMNIAGRLKRQGSLVKVYHVAEVLASMTDNVPAIAEGKDSI